MRRSHRIGVARPIPHPGSIPKQARSVTRTHAHRTVWLCCALGCWVFVAGIVAQSPEDAVDDQAEGRPVATWPDGPTHASVYDELENSGDGRAFVIVGLRPLERGISTLEEYKEEVKSKQERVLGKLAPGEFQIAYQYATFAALAGRVNSSGLMKLARDADVVAIGPDLTGEFFLGESVPFIRADEVHSTLGVTGALVTVAVIDTGVDWTHPDLVADTISEGAYHFFGQGADTGPGAMDIFGHGTHMAGIITSDGILAPKGVAPDARILPISILDPVEHGGAFASDLLAAVNYVIDNAFNYDISVMNTSLGLIDPSTGGEWTAYLDCCDQLHPTLTVLGEAFQAARDLANVITFAASGHSGCVGIQPPACLESTVAVVHVFDLDYGQVVWPPPPFPSGCTDETTQPDLIPCPASRGQCNKLAAPGVNILAPMSTLNMLPQCPAGVLTCTLHGTSQATAHVSGVAALLVSQAACGALTPADIESFLLSTGVLPNDPCFLGPLPIRVDAFAAVSALNPVCFGPHDLNCDGRVDFLDLVFILDCWFGPGIGVGGVCVCADTAEAPPDGDVDLRDFAPYQRSVAAAGACCDFNGPDTCDVMTPVDCAATPGSYLGNGTPCTHCTGACCDFDGVDTCDVMSEADCAATPGTYQGGGTDCSACIPTACVGAQGDCCVVHGTPGCDDEECCAIVCAMDSFCCKGKWDELCADAAQANCAICGP